VNTPYWVNCTLSNFCALLKYNKFLNLTLQHYCTVVLYNYKLFITTFPFCCSFCTRLYYENCQEINNFEQIFIGPIYRWVPCKLLLQIKTAITRNYVANRALRHTKNSKSKYIDARSLNTVIWCDFKRPLFRSKRQC